MKAVVLNDTSHEKHHGCSRVMENLYRELDEYDVEISAVSYLNGDLHSPSLMTNLNTCDLAIINGEGTIHHGNIYAERMLKLVSNSAARTKVLLNSTYDSNPSHYQNYLAEFDMIFVRDGQSEVELTKIDIPSQVIPDLTFLSGRDPKIDPAQQISVGCSVDREVSVQLHKIGKTLGERAHPLSIFEGNGNAVDRVIEVRRSLGTKDLLKPVSMLRMMQARIWFSRHACIHHQQYSAELTRSEYLISGRYHAICMAIKNRTPFLAIDSNTFKINALLDDVGITNRCISKPDFLADSTVNLRPFSKGELERIASFDQDAQVKIQNMFERIVQA